MDRTTQREILARLNRDAAVLASRFSLSYRGIEAERANVKSRFGICYSDGLIKLRLRHAVTGKPLKYSSIVNTLCHELAHLRHFHHGESFQLYYRRILEHARELGIYQPRTQRPVAPPPPRALPQPKERAPEVPLQLDLFA